MLTISLAEDTLTAEIDGKKESVTVAGDLEAAATTLRDRLVVILEGNEVKLATEPIQLNGLGDELSEESSAVLGVFNQ